MESNSDSNYFYKIISIFLTLISIIALVAIILGIIAIVKINKKNDNNMVNINPITDISIPNIIITSSGQCNSKISLYYKLNGTFQLYRCPDGKNNFYFSNDKNDMINLKLLLKNVYNNSLIETYYTIQLATGNSVQYYIDNLFPGSRYTAQPVVSYKGYDYLTSNKTMFETNNALINNMSLFASVNRDHVTIIINLILNYESPVMCRCLVNIKYGNDIQYVITSNLYYSKNKTLNCYYYSLHPDTKYEYMVQVSDATNPICFVNSTKYTFMTE